MSADEYVSKRLDDQIGWYDRKGLRNQRWFKRLRFFEFVAAAAIPIIVTTAPTLTIVVAILGALIAVVAAVLGLYQFEPTWIEYRTTCESLKKEKFLFLTRTEPYEGDDTKAFALLVQRVETLVSKENTNWAQYMMKPTKGGSTNG